MGWLISKRMKCFIAAFEEKNINKACETLFVSRSPFMKMIDEIEAVHNAKLFLRAYNKLEPTNESKNIYGKIKPLYESLLEIEKDGFNGEKNVINIVFDVSVPCEIYDKIVSLLCISRCLFTHVRIAITANNLMQYTNNENSIIISLRKIIANDIMNEKIVCESNLCLVKPSIITSKMKSDADSNLPILIKDNRDSYIYESWISDILKDKYPLIAFERCEYDFFIMLFKVSCGSNMMILPEKIARFYTLPMLDISVVKNRSLKVRCYYNIPIERLSKILEVIKKLL